MALPIFIWTVFCGSKSLQVDSLWPPTGWVALWLNWLALVKRPFGSGHLLEKVYQDKRSKWWDDWTRFYIFHVSWWIYSDRIIVLGWNGEAFSEDAKLMKFFFVKCEEHGSTATRLIHSKIFKDVAENASSGENQVPPVFFFQEVQKNAKPKKTRLAPLLLET